MRPRDLVVERHLRRYLERKLLFARRHIRSCAIQIEQIEKQIAEAEAEQVLIAEREGDPVKTFFDDQHALRMQEAPR